MGHYFISFRPYLFLIVFIASFVITYVISNPSKEVEIPTNRITYTPEYSFNHGNEIALVYITSAHCGFCKLPEMPNLIEQSKMRARNAALENGASFATIGVVVDWNVDQGFDHLRQFGEFDEVIIGRNWFNTGARKFIYADTTVSRGSVPQLVIVSRVNNIQINDTRSIYDIKEQNIIARYRGVEEIKKYANNQ